MKIASSKKLWKIIRQTEGYYYEIRMDGVILDRIKVEEPALHILEDKGELE